MKPIAWHDDLLAFAHGLASCLLVVLGADIVFIATDGAKTKQLPGDANWSMAMHVRM